MNCGRIENPDEFLVWAEHEVDWRRENVHLFGRQIQVPRRVAWFGEPGLNYRYSGLDHVAQGWPPLLHRLRDELQRTFDVASNFVLLNRYEDGSQYMGWHRDDERNIGRDVCSVSLGAQRRFLLENEAGERQTLQLPHGSVLLHPGRWRHCLPKTALPVGVRINLSFREVRVV